MGENFDRVVVGSPFRSILSLTLLHSERPKLYTILAFMSAVGLTVASFNGEITLSNPWESFPL